MNVVLREWLVNMNQCNRFRSVLSYFVFHQDKLDASFFAVCFILLYWPIIVSFFASVKTVISIQPVAIVNLNITLATLLDFSAATQNEIGFPIRVGRFVCDLVCDMKGWYLRSST